MISPELLRRFPFFAGFSDQQLKALAMIADEIELPVKTVVFEEGSDAKKFYILIEGSIDLTIKSEEESDSATRRIFAVGEINPGEVFGINALLEPFTNGFTETTEQNCELIEFDAVALKALMEGDKDFAYQLMMQVAKSLMERLYNTRVQLAAAWA